VAVALAAEEVRATHCCCKRIMLFNVYSFVIVSMVHSRHCHCVIRWIPRWSTGEVSVEVVEVEVTGEVSEEVAVEVAFVEVEAGDRGGRGGGFGGRG
jgi:hypothetical protein